MSQKKEFRKEYVGKGKAHKSLDIVTITIEADEVAKHTHEYNGTKYITMEVAKLKNPDNYGRSHTVYVNNLVPVEETEKEQPKAKGKGKGASSKKETAEA